MVADLKTALLALAVIPFTASLQVSPGSPCAAFCLDPGQDRFDPDASTTRPSEIACHDEDFSTSSQGMKYQRCLTCLQDSDYTNDGESDQEWFLYNLRYSFNYCIFGFPNATGIDSSPCTTSEACEPLAQGLREGIIDPSRMEPYDYCTAHGGSTLGDHLSPCLQCVHAGSTHHYMSNFLIALEAGCRQQPSAGVLLGLNDTVFTRDSIEIVAPGSVSDVDSPGGLSTGALIGIIIGCVVVVLLIGGCTYMHIRRRKNRSRRSQIFDRPIASPMSFRCQTRVTPLDAEFPPGVQQAPEKPYADPAAALSSNPISGPNRPSRFTPADLTSITTSLPKPPTAFSPSQRMSPDDYNTPISTTSTHSNAPLLHQHRPYVPSEYTNSPPQMSTPFFTQAHSPRLNANRKSSFGQKDVSPVSPWDDQSTAGYGRSITGKRSPVGMGTPVEVRPIQVSFPPPPKR